MGISDEIELMVIVIDETTIFNIKGMIRMPLRSSLTMLVVQ